MSIFIFGNTVQNEENSSLNWTGSWYFAKNKTLNTSFSYSKCASNAVPKDLVDYVSFTNEPQEKGAGTRKGRKGKWNRGRPRSNSSATATVEANPTPEDRDAQQLDPMESGENDADKGKDKDVSKEEGLVDDQPSIEMKTEPMDTIIDEANLDAPPSSNVDCENYMDVVESAPLTADEEGRVQSGADRDSDIDRDRDSDRDRDRDRQGEVSVKQEEVEENTDVGAVDVKMEPSVDINTANNSTTDVSTMVVGATDICKEEQQTLTSPDVSSPAPIADAVPLSVPSTILIPPRHPLFGLWEGSFTLPAKTNNHGTRGERREVEVVEESFFFYAFEGEQRQQQSEDGAKGIPGMEGLPNPPRWTAAYIRELHSADRHDDQEQLQPGTEGETGTETVGETESKVLLEDNTHEEPTQGQESRMAALVIASSGGESPTAPLTDVGDAPRPMKKEVSFGDLVGHSTSSPTVQPRKDEDEGMEGQQEVCNKTNSEPEEQQQDQHHEQEEPTPIKEESEGGEEMAGSRTDSASDVQLDGDALAASLSAAESTIVSPMSIKETPPLEFTSADSYTTVPAATSSAPTPRFSQHQSTPNSALLVPPAEEVMVVGFGRNQYGRFSLAGAYNPRTGSLRCERKYMLTKNVTPARQHAPRLSGGSTSVDPDSGGSGKRPVRAKRAFSMDMSSSASGHDKSLGSTGVGAESTGGSGKRKRSSSQWLQEGGQEGASALSDGVAVPIPAPLKRGRKKGQVYASSASKSTSAQSEKQTQSHAMTCSQFLKVLSAAAEKDGYRRAFLDPSTGEVYEGEWSNGQRNGFGVALFPDGTLYEGWWLHNKEHGPAGLWMTGAREVLYSGEWSEGRLHGSGTYNFPSGDVYVGEFKEGARHGKGRYTRADGSSYEGDWKDNLRHGRGVFRWTDGSEYSGDWEGGQRCGRGELYLSNDLSYSGTWAANIMEGRGELRFPDGQEYKGIFKNGLREGRGSLMFPEGAMYEGRFREDALDGQGTLKITKSVPGGGDDEVYVPLDNLADIRRIHFKSGFGGDAHH